MVHFEVRPRQRGRLDPRGNDEFFICRGAEPSRRRGPRQASETPSTLDGLKKGDGSTPAGGQDRVKDVPGETAVDVKRAALPQAHGAAAWTHVARLGTPPPPLELDASPYSERRLLRRLDMGTETAKGLHSLRARSKTPG